MPPQFPTRVLVVGDVMLDLIYHGPSRRLTPDAPVPVIHVDSREASLGGAANVARELRCLEVGAVLSGFAGNDEHRQKLSACMKELEIDEALATWEGHTTTKITVMAESSGGESQKVARLDFETQRPPTPEERAALLGRVTPRLAGCGALVLSDYDKGTCTTQTCQHLISLAREMSIPVLVDPKGKDWSKYQGATLVKPNLSELGMALGASVANEIEAIEQGARRLLETHGLQAIFVTRDKLGASLVTREIALHLPPLAQKMTDVIGAGDAVMAAFAASLATGASLENAARTGNAAGALRVEKGRKAPLTPTEVSARVAGVPSSKRLELGAVGEVCRSLRREGKRIVFTNGCFDLLHNGHITHLSQAKSLGDVLIVGINDDASVRRIKGEGRPLMCLADRLSILSSLFFIDHILVFEEDTPHRYLEEIRPDILVKGGNLTLDEVVGRELAGKTMVLPLIGDYSTARLIEGIRATKEKEDRQESL